MHNRFNEYFDDWLEKNKHLLINKDEFVKRTKADKLFTCQDTYVPKNSKIIKKNKF